MELAPNEVIISPADYLTSCSYTEPEDEFTGYSFSQIELPKSDLKPNELPSKFRWRYLPMIDIEILSSSYARVKSIELIERIISSRHLDKQQKFVIQNTILSSLGTQPHFYNILLRHFLSVLVILSSWILSFYLFLAVLTLIAFYLISQICKNPNFLIFTIKTTFTKVLEDLCIFEKLVDELSVSLKLLTQIQIIEKATFSMKTTQQQNVFTLNKLKQLMTDLYSNLFFTLQTKTSFLPIQNVPFDKDELICTLEREDILNRIYQEIPDNLNELCFTKMSLDTFKFWHCLLMCQFGEYLHILVSIIDRNLQIQNSESWLTQQMEIIRYGHSLRIPEHEAKLNSLTQLTTWARLDLYSLNCRDRNDLPKERFCPRKDCRLETLDKIDFILQRCLLKVRNIKDSESNCSVGELRSLKFCLENVIEGVENLGKPSPLQPSESKIEPVDETPKDQTGNELILPTSNLLEVPQSEEIIFEGFSREEEPRIDRNHSLLQKEEYINTGAARTVLKELKCVLADKQILKTEDNLDVNEITSVSYRTSDDSCKMKSQSFQPTSAQNLLNFAILNSAQSNRLEQTVIGDDSD